MLKINEYPIGFGTDRDCEIPNFLEFLKYYKGRYESLLDVGAHYSANTYGPDVRKLVKKYTAFDPQFDQKVADLCDDFIVGDAVVDPLPAHDVVVCLSTLEHVGQYPIVYPDYIEKRHVMFKKILEAAKKYFWLSVPVGLPHLIEKEMAIFGEQEFERMEKTMEPYITDFGFFFSEGPQAGHPWRPIGRKEVFNKPYIDSLGNRGLCVIEGVV